MSTVVIDPSKCDGCGVCLQSCPVDMLRFDEATKKAYVAYPGDCHVCCLCEDDCPQKAIAVDYAMANPRQISIYDSLDIPIPKIDGYDI
jgi:NAD-dependent dihydropyrimidine dehydrogenase PreA subunit